MRSTLPDPSNSGTAAGNPLVIMFRPNGGLGVAYPPQFGPFGPTPQVQAQSPFVTALELFGPPQLAQQPQPQPQSQPPQPATNAAPPRPSPSPAVGAPPAETANGGLLSITTHSFSSNGPLPWPIREGYIIVHTGVPADPAPDPDGAEELLRSLPNIYRRTLRRIDRVLAALHSRSQKPSGAARDEESDNENERKGWECSICLEGVEDWRSSEALGVKALPCNHFFHGECLRGWFVTKHTW